MILLLDGRKEDVHFDKITSRIQKLCYNLDMDFVDPVSLLIFQLHLAILKLKLGIYIFTTITIVLVLSSIRENS